MIDDKINNNPKSKKQGKVTGKVSLRSGGILSSPLPSPVNIMYRGYFPIWRKIEDWGWYKDGNTMRVFFHLLIHANFRESNYLGHTIYPGEVVSGRKALAVSLGLGERQVRTALKHLIATTEITIKTCSKFSIITLINFNKYTIATNGKSGRSPASDRQVTTSNNDKNDKNTIKRERTSFSPPTIKEIQEYCDSTIYRIDVEKFTDFYTSKGWMVGKTKMKDWKAAVRNWFRSQVKPFVKKATPIKADIKEPKKLIIRPDYSPEAKEKVKKLIADMVKKGNK